MLDTTEILTSTLQKDLSAIFSAEQFLLIGKGISRWPDQTLTQYRAVSLLSSLVKKFNDKDEPSKKACDAALEKFVTVNRYCDEWVYAPRCERDAELIGEFSKHLYEFWCTSSDGSTVASSLAAVMHRGGVGKGSSALCRAPDFYTKLFDGPLSSTKPSLLDFWRDSMSRMPLWSNAESTRHDRYGASIVEGNKLSFVNKNVHTARCISTEPLINMWFQKGLGGLMEDRLAQAYGISLDTQPAINGELARIGSLAGSYSTIDLESASDCVSLKMLERLAPKGMLNLLKLFRSDVCVLPGNRRLVLNMLATMGNATTFPLQTIVFMCVVRSVYGLRGIPLTRVEHRSFDPKGKNYGVFGDDIIVESSAAREVLHLLSLLGFIVNKEKTHIEGPFRESCGYDWFNGQPCRGVYIKRLRTAQDTYVAINRLNCWSAMTGIALSNTVRWLRSQVSCAAPMVPCDEDDTAGIHVPSDLVQKPRRGLHGCLKYLKDAPVFFGQVVPFGSDQYNVQIVPSDAGVAGSDVDRKVNRAGLLISFLGGYVMGRSNDHHEARFAERNMHVVYATEHASTPNWDSFPITTCPSIRELVRPNRSRNYYDFAAWSAAVTCNL